MGPLWDPIDQLTAVSCRVDSQALGPFVETDLPVLVSVAMIEEAECACVRFDNLIDEKGERLEFSAPQFLISVDVQFRELPFDDTPMDAIPARTGVPFTSIWAQSSLRRRRLRQRN